MKWVPLGIAASLSFSGASASINAILAAKFNTAPGSQLLAHKPHFGLASTVKNNATTPNLSVLTHLLDRRQNAGRCGADFSSQRCPDNQCCSAYGYCGNEFEFCAPIVGCQPEYGRCGDAPPIVSSSTTPIPPPTSTPAPPPSSSSSTPIISSSTSSSVTPPLPSGSLIVSPNGQCGNVTTCAGSGFGGCCSEWYFCGNSIDYCGVGCRSAFGTCGGAPPISSSSSPIPSSTPPPPTSTPPPPTSTPPPPSSTPPPVPSSSSRTSSAAPVPTIPVSTNGQCGNGVTCTGSTYGQCCSDYYWCGNQEEYCRVAYGCRPEWGTCASTFELGLMGAM